MLCNLCSLVVRSVRLRRSLFVLSLLLCLMPTARAQGPLLAWGEDSNGQVSNTPTTGQYIAVAAGVDNSVAIRSDGSLVSWGDDSYGAVSNTPTTGTYRAIAAGWYHSVAILNNSPLANAGTAQTLSIPHDGNPNTNTIPVSLDASASSDPDGDALTYAWDDGLGHTANTATPLFNLPAGVYPFTLTVTDAYGAQSTASVQITVNPETNQAPTANDQSLALNQDTNRSITLTGSDPENDALTYTVGTPAHGTLSGTAPNLTYTPSAGYAGSDSFTFTLTDAYGAVSTAATISLSIKDTTPPVITLNGFNPMSLNQGSAFTDPGATARDNVDGTVPVSVSGSVNTALPGTYTLTYSAQDAAGNQASTTRTVNVVAVAPKVSVKLTAIGQLLGVVGIVVTINNGGNTTISNVKITSASLIDVKAALILPNGFNLGAGKSADVGLAFYPLKKGQKGTLSINGNYSGGTFSLNQAVTIP